MRHLITQTRSGAFITSMASLCIAVSPLRYSASPIPRSLSLPPLRIQSTSASSSLTFSHLSKRRSSANRTVCFSIKSENGGEGEGEEEGGSEDSLADALFSSVRNDSGYLWKVAAGSVGGASAIKYGSILFPDVTRPNIIQGLLMVSLPVVVAVLILLKESYLGGRDED